MRTQYDEVGDFHLKFGLKAVPGEDPLCRLPNCGHSGSRHVDGNGASVPPLCLDCGSVAPWGRHAFEAPAPVVPALVTDGSLVRFRLKFIEEETDELKFAIQRGDLPGIADALVDLVYVAMGTAHLYGIPFDACFEGVQRANMAKERCRIDHKFVPANEGEVWSKETEGMCHRINADQTGVCGQSQHKHSLRGSSNDVIKPAGWTAPDIAAVLREKGWEG